MPVTHKTQGLEARFEKEVRLEREFLTKWINQEARLLYGDYWTSTPSTLYWCLTYDAIDGLEKIGLAKELVAIYASTSPAKNNTSISHARQVLARASRDNSRRASLRFK